MQKAIEYAEKNLPQFIEHLKELARIPSISFDGFPPEEVKRSAQAVAKHFKDMGLENVEVLEIPGAHPYVYGDYLHAPGKPTLLLYAHHDVQPPGNEELWKSPPFEPVERNGRLFGRGTADDKAGIVVHTSAIASYLKTVGTLPVNVKLISEGEEEIGSIHLEQFLSKYKDKMKADAIVLTDTGNYDTGIPTITTSLRGLIAVDVEVQAMEQSVHSGQWGGGVPDPVLGLSKMLAKLVDDKGRIAIPGIYDDVTPMTAVEKESLKKLDYTESEYRRQTRLLPGVEIVGGSEMPLEKMTRLPSLSVNAIQASSRKHAANVVNGSAWAKVGIRLGPGMDPDKTQKQLTDFLEKAVPWGMKVTFKAESGAPAWSTKTEGPAFEKAALALKKAFGRETVFLGTGGSIPFVGPFASVLGGVPALLIGVEDPYTNAHSENESMDLGDFKKAILGAIYYYDLMSQA